MFTGSTQPGFTTTANFFRERERRRCQTEQRREVRWNLNGDRNFRRLLRQPRRQAVDREQHSDKQTSDAANFALIAETHFDAAFTSIAAGGTNDPSNTKHDIGVEILQKPPSVTPLSMNRTALTPDLVSTQLRLLGYDAAHRTVTRVRGLCRSGVRRRHSTPSASGLGDLNTRKPRHAGA